MNGEPIRSRKADHIEICLKENVSQDHCYWNDVHLMHDAMPEIDMEDVDTSTYVLGTRLSFPFIVTAITGGFSGAKKINANIAEACAELGVGMGVGSERAGVAGVEPESYSVVKDYDVPLVIGNVGAPQLVPQRSKDRITEEMVGRAFELVGADFVAVHLNYLQEVIQPEGDTNARGVRDAIRDLARDYPLIVKETGAGIDSFTAERLRGIGVRGIDVEGMGGTSFSAVEMYRAAAIGDEMHEEMGNTFFSWGIPAPVSLVECRCAKLPLIASGGILNGVHAAAAIAMGAQAAGAAHLFLREASESAEAVRRKLILIREELRAAMMLTGSANIQQLSEARYAVLGETKDWMEGLSWTQRNI